MCFILSGDVSKQGRRRGRFATFMEMRHVLTVIVLENAGLPTEWPVRFDLAMSRSVKLGRQDRIAAEVIPI